MPFPAGEVRYDDEVPLSEPFPMFRSIVGALLLSAGWLVIHGAAVELIDGRQSDSPALQWLVCAAFLALAVGGGARLCRRWALVSAVELLALAPCWGLWALHAALWGRWGTAAAWSLLALADVVLGVVFLVAFRRPRQAFR